MNKSIDGERLANAFRLLLTAALFGAPAFAAPAPAPANAQKSTHPKFEEYVEAYGKCQDGSIDLVGARDPALSARYRSMFDGWAPEVQTALELRQACLSSIPGEEKSCDVLSRPKGWSGNCQDLVSYGSFLEAVFDGKSDAREAYNRFRVQISWTDSGGHRATSASGRHHGPDSVIAILKRGSADFCSAAKVSVLRGDERKYKICQERLEFLDGVPDHCASDPNKDHQPLCREKASLLAALRAKNFQACALSPWCVAMTGHRAESCEPYLSRATKAFCARAATVVTPYLKEKAARDAQLRAMKGNTKPVYPKGAPMHTNIQDILKQMKKIDDSRQ